MQEKNHTKNQGSTDFTVSLGCDGGLSHFILTFFPHQVRTGSVLGHLASCLCPHRRPGRSCLAKQEVSQVLLLHCGRGHPGVTDLLWAQAPEDQALVFVLLGVRRLRRQRARRQAALRAGPSSPTTQESNTTGPHTHRCTLGVCQLWLRGPMHGIYCI